MKFNPPPNWPQPPAGWSPPAGWQPDPAWGPPPKKWRLWIEETAAAPTAATPPPTKEQRVFISYRRSDSQAQANGLHDGLRHRLPGAKIFMDIDSIPPGVDFEEHIRREIEVCDIVLVLIGDEWLVAPDETARRIDQPGDFVRLEVESALASPRVRVIPVLVEGAEMPSQAELPESIRRLARLNAIELSDRRWIADLQRLSTVIEELARDQELQATRGAGPAGPSASDGAPRGATVASASTTTPRPPGPVQRSQPPPPPSWQPASPPPGGLAPAAQRSSFEQRTGVPTLGLVALASSVFCCGFTSFVPPLWAAVTEREDKRFRGLMFAAAAVLAGLFVLGLTLVSVAPEDAQGTSTGPLADTAGVLLISLWVAGMALAATILVRASRMRERSALPGVSAEMERSRLRQQYRELAAQDPAMALRIGVGRPDVARNFDDGGLLDLNNIARENLHRCLPVQPDEAQRIVEARDLLGRFASIEEVASYAILSDASTARLRPVAVFL